MSNFEYKKYPKIYNMHTEEAQGILDGDVTVQLKLDGANSSVYLRGGKVRCGTRTRQLPLEESFRGLQEHINSNNAIEQYLIDNPSHILYGEWLVKHSINYTQDYMNKWYLFDIYNTETSKYLDQSAVIDAFVDQEHFGAKNEGVVIKPVDFINSFGDRVYAKRVSQQFKEKNAIVFGGNNKHSETYWEMFIVNKYCSIATLEKNLNKLAPEIGRIDKSHTARVANTCVHDTITENIWEIFKKVPAVNFKKLSLLMMRKYIQLFHDKLDNSYSVADTGEE